jgi:photosystem II stability/assembly factor-like uncharacterized protein
MKKEIIIFIVTILGFYSCDNNNALPIQTVSQLTLGSLKELETNLPLADYNDLTFKDEKNGYAISQDGGIADTEDGGLSWKSIPSPVTFSLRKIQFTDSNTGYIIGGDRTGAYLLKTIDAGQTWSVIDLNAAVKNFPTGMFFTNNNIGFITGKSLFIKTTDGGKTFTNVLENSLDDFASVGFDGANGIATSSKGIYYETTDGGSSWQKKQANTAADLREVYFVYSKVYIKKGESSLLDVKNNTAITLPNGAFKFLFLSPSQSIGIGQHYNQTGFFPYGDVLLTNDLWTTSLQKTYSPDLSLNFKCVARVNKQKAILIGSGILFNTVLEVNF